MMINGIPIFAVVGPTGVGKTKLCIALAKALNGEVVSVDSLQVYQKAGVMTAKPTLQEMDSITHYLIDYLKEDEEPVDYVNLAIATIKKIHSCGKIPILCGGSTSLTKPLLFHEFVQRQSLNVIVLHSKLSDLGKRLDKRIDQMILDGLCEEVQLLYQREHELLSGPNYSQGIWKAIGYRELRPWAEAAGLEVSDERLERGIKLMKDNTRNYAKLQLSWIWSDLVPALMKTDCNFASLLVTNASTFNNRVVPQGILQCYEWLMVSTYCV